MTYREQALYDADEYSTGEYVESETHVPATDAVRAVYATDYYMVEVGSRGTPVGRAEAFDRWLARERAHAILEFIERQGVEYRAHSGAAIEEDRMLAVRHFGVDPDELFGGAKYVPDEYR